MPATFRQQVGLARARAGFTTLEAADGQEGLAQLEANGEIALVVCDVNMPNLDGLELLAIVKPFDPLGTMRYVGGYFDNPAAVTARDERVFGRVGRGEVAAPLPVYGCAVSRKLQKAVDPLGTVS